MRGISTCLLVLRVHAAAWLTSLVAATIPTEVLADRYLVFYPAATHSGDNQRGARPSDFTADSPEQNTDQTNVPWQLPSAAAGITEKMFDEPTLQAWQTYCETWQRYHRTPNDATLRKRLAIADDPFAFTPNQSKSALTARMPLTGLKRYDSVHFQLYTDVKGDRLPAVITQLEQFYCAWSQLFFPLWNQASLWNQATAGVEHPAAPRTKSGPKHRVILFADLARYQEALRHEGDVVGQSTGFYSDLLRLSFFCDQGDQREETMHHELTHQLLMEATSATGRFRPGERTGFWWVEGIATYMESLQRQSDFASIGGWESPRLQFARQRMLGSGVQLTLAELQNESRRAVQGRTELGAWYSHVAAYIHALIDSDEYGLPAVLSSIASVYQIRRGLKPGARPALPEIDLMEYLQLDDNKLEPIFSTTLRSVCLSRTQVTLSGLAKVPTQTELRWLDAGFLPVNSSWLSQWLPEPRKLAQLNLESTAIDDECSDWLAAAPELQELDLSNTQVGDRVVLALPATMPLETLWLTGSRVTDACLERIAEIRSLQQVDVQATKVTDQGLQKLKTARPDLSINPLQVVTQ